MRIERSLLQVKSKGRKAENLCYYNNDVAYLVAIYIWYIYVTLAIRCLLAERNKAIIYAKKNNFFQNNTLHLNNKHARIINCCIVELIA